MVERQLLAQARLPLAQRAGTPSNGRDVLAQAEVEALEFITIYGILGLQ